jgi:hypothetical protein
MERRSTAYVSADDAGAALKGGPEGWGLAGLGAGSLRGRPPAPTPSCPGGTSVVEVLVSLLFVSILGAMSYGFSRAALRSARIQEAKSEAQEVTVMALDVLARELRVAGFSAAAAPLTGIRSAGREHVEIACDLDGNGDTAGANELIAYAYDGLKRQLTRATGGASPQPFVYNVPPGGVCFSYFDGSGQELSTGTGDLTAQQCGRVHRIDVRLRVEIPNPNPDDPAPLKSTVSSTICLRNQ